MNKRYTPNHTLTADYEGSLIENVLKSLELDKHKFRTGHCMEFGEYYCDDNLKFCVNDKKRVTKVYNILSEFIYG